MRVTYAPIITEPEIAERVRARFRARMAELEALGFRELCVYSETTPAFGLLAGFLALPLEVTRIHGLLRLSLYELLMFHRDYASYALPFGLGTKFYTLFADGTLWISGNFSSPVPNLGDDECRYYRFCKPCSPASAWRFHRAMVDAFRYDGKQVCDRISFADYTEMSAREDAYPYFTRWLYRARRPSFGAGQ